MKRLRNHLVGVDQGSVLMFSDFEDDGIMWSGEGPRACRRDVTFAERYRSAPTVHVAISMWDMDGDTNQRADIAAEKVTPEGFTLAFRTWGDSRVARVRVSWLAIGELRHDDDWELF